MIVTVRNQKTDNENPDREGGGRMRGQSLAGPPHEEQA